MNKMVEGRGNLISQVARLKLGTSKKNWTAGLLIVRTSENSLTNVKSEQLMANDQLIYAWPILQAQDGQTLDKVFLRRHRRSFH